MKFINVCIIQGHTIPNEVDFTGANQPWSLAHTLSVGMRRQGFFGAAMLPMSELKYTGIMDKLKLLDKRFTIRA
ncbi:fructose 1,6-bisphosphatase [Sulfuriflexus sp.]|uniref:fructose 1,6-bisphosphatase n=1 Tax=Sulfuriflexus sp. TaxID=2015443 RepID=UPI0028CD28B5|nr:fructose 1,6-bisphosphatase [Sulfuriflexus sp.]MDT8404718.1 fructose 1,6-bisphosphatase [Sulfuriflexus sp.]